MTHQEPAEIGYRLQPADLAGRVHTFTISAVSLEGLESMQPVAHFAETRKKLLLSPDHCRSLILLTGSTLFRDWVGARIRITAARSGGYATIRILPVHEFWPWSRRWHAWRQRFTQRDAAQHESTRPGRTRPPWIDSFAKPVLVIALLSVVSFLGARAYGAGWLSLIERWIAGV